MDELLDWTKLSFDAITNPKTVMGAVILAVLTIAVAAVISRFLSFLLRRSSWTIGQLGRPVDATAVRAIIHIKTLVVFLLAAVFYGSRVPALRSVIHALAAGAGITAIVVGLAAKSTIANIVAGFALTIYRPIRIGDTRIEEKAERQRRTRLGSGLLPTPT